MNNIIDSIKRIKLRNLFQYYKGRLWCLTFHAPVIREMSGYGGSNHWGRRRKAYHPMWCVKCGNQWEQKDFGEQCHGPQAWHWRFVERKARRDAKNKTKD